MIVLIDHLDVFKHDEKPLSQTRSPVQAGERHILLLQLAEQLDRRVNGILQPVSYTHLSRCYCKPKREVR